MLRIRPKHSLEEIDRSFSASDCASPARIRAVHGLLILCTVLLVAVTSYAIWARELGLLDSVLTLVGNVVIAILGWAIGRHGSTG